MNTLIKRAMIAAGITTAMALPLASQASDGTITFTGAVTASTCTLSVNGGANAGTATVALPTVDTASLTAAGAATSTAAGTFFSVGVTGCTAAHDLGAPSPGGTAPTHVQIYFEAGPTVDQATGGLINTTGVGFSNVEVKLYNASGSTVVGTQIMPGTGTNQPTALVLTAGGTQWFYAGYSTSGAGAAGATAGAVNTQVTYSLIYN
jgi:major type 1 subunit fimbrin (pilin)